MGADNGADAGIWGADGGSLSEAPGRAAAGAPEGGPLIGSGFGMRGGNVALKLSWLAVTLSIQAAFTTFVSTFARLGRYHEAYD